VVWIRSVPIVWQVLKCSLSPPMSFSTANPSLPASCMLANSAVVPSATSVVMSTTTRVDRRRLFPNPCDTIRGSPSDTEHPLDLHLRPAGLRGPAHVDRSNWCGFCIPTPGVQRKWFVLDLRSTRGFIRLSMGLLGAHLCLVDGVRAFAEQPTGASKAPQSVAIFSPIPMGMAGGAGRKWL
jgi:hypothetical protein